MVYTDKEGLENIKKLNINVDTTLIDYDEYSFNKGFWNFPKLITYNLQEKPFIHIDIDSEFIKDPKIGDSDVITEGVRGVFNLFSFKRSFLGEEINSNYDANIVCSGLVGGSNLNVFKELFEISSDIADDFIGDPSYDDMICIEEVVLTHLCKKNKLDIKVLDNNVFKHYYGDIKNKV